jgi:Fe-S cluster assembly protein SufD
MPALSAKQREVPVMNVLATPHRTPSETALIDGFAERTAALPGDRAVAVKRELAVETLKNGLPSRRVEAWHYTDLRRFLTSVPAFGAAGAARPVAATLEGSTVLTVLNGVAQGAHPVQGVTVSRLKDKLADGSFAPAMDVQDPADTIGAINAAYVADGYFVEIAEGAQLAAPLELQNVQAGGQTHTRFAVHIGDGAKATIVERQTGTDGALASSISHLLIAEGAEVTWVIVQDQPRTATHLGQFNAWIGKNAKLTLFVMNAGGKLVRQEVRVKTTGEGADFKLRGINLLAGDNHTDVTMMLDHAVANTTSTEIIRNVVTDRARGVFQGMIRVAPGAQKTDAKMACNTLLLSDEGEFSAKPELEIFADDVVCGHGATVTEIDADHLFYLMARGIDEKTARGLLVQAFLAEVIEELEDEPVVEALEQKLHAWFAVHG